MRDDLDLRTTIDLDDDVLQAAKELAAMQKTTAGRVVSELVRKALRARATTPRVRNSVPLLRPRTGPPILTMSLVNELREEA